jgi:predicted heme/steroid binding protein/uncharacterized membrane protein
LADELKEFSLKDLQEFHGAEGKPAYIAFEGRIMDISASEHWHYGHHMGTHQAGNDLTQEIDAAPHGPEVLERFPQVGVLKTEEAEREEFPAFLSRLFHYVPLLRRHPHPMVVHFPIVFMIATTGFTILYLLTGYRSFETTAWHCLWGGVLFTPVAIATGLFTWWINYEAEWLRQVIIKMVLSSLLFFIALIALIWRYRNPDILASWGTGSLVYFGLIFTLTPLVVAIGWFGATLSFPLEEE